MNVDIENTVSRVLKGDVDAFREIIFTFKGYLWRIAVSYIKDVSQIEEILQRTFIRAYSSIRTYQQGRDFKVWLKAIVINEVRRPQETPLYRLVQENLETFLADSREACFDDDPIPPYVERTFRKYLECGIPAFGVARARCASCGYDFLVPFSCKTRGLCPSCNTRRMVETAAYLVDHVIPRVPMRQWVLTVPKRVRYFLQRDPRLFSGVLRVFMRALNTALRRHSPGAPSNSRFGAVAFLHRAGSSLNEHPHLHSTATDGVFAPDADGQARFFQASDMTPDTIRYLKEKLRTRILSHLERHGCLDPVDVEDMLSWQHEGGFSLDASVHIDDWDRNALDLK